MRRREYERSTYCIMGEGDEIEIEIKIKPAEKNLQQHLCRHGAVKLIFFPGYTWIVIEYNPWLTLT